MIGIGMYESSFASLGMSRLRWCIVSASQPSIRCHSSMPAFWFDGASHCTRICWHSQASRLGGLTKGGQAGSWQSRRMSSGLPISVHLSLSLSLSLFLSLSLSLPISMSISIVYMYMHMLGWLGRCLKRPCCESLRLLRLRW